MTNPPHAVRCLKTAGRRSVWLIERPGERARTLKVWALTPAMLAKLAVGAAQPQRQIRGARRLRRAGVETPPVTGPWRFVRRDGRIHVELELEHVRGRGALEVLERGEEDPPRLKRCAEGVGRMVHAIASAGLFHRDLKLENLVVAEGGDDRIWLIDPVGVRPALNRSRAIVRMFDRLLVESAVYGIRMPAAVWRRAVRAALGDQPRAVRLGVFRLIRSHMRRQFARWGVSALGAGADHGE